MGKGIHGIAYRMADVDERKQMKKRTIRRITKRWEPRAPKIMVASMIWETKNNTDILLSVAGVRLGYYEVVEPFTRPVCKE